jgi:hypothetical protein
VANPEYGKWSTMADAPPSGSHGVLFGRQSTWKVVIEVAKITAANLGGSPQPAWVDITSRVIDLSWQRGDAALESRLPIGSMTVRCKAISDLVGEPMVTSVSANDRFGTQSLIRWSLFDGTNWLPQFTGYIDTITEDWAPDQAVRVFEMECFDTLYYLAGYRRNATYGTLGTTFEGALMGLLGTAGSGCSFPFTRSYLGVPGTNTIGGEPGQAPLQLLHRIADSVGGSAFALGTGQLVVYPWDIRTGLPGYLPAWWVVDGYAWVAAGSTYAFPAWAQTIVPTAMRWVNSVDRMVHQPTMFSTKYGGTYGSLTTLSAKFRNRFDRPGWPKLDLLYSNAGGTDVLPDLDAALTRNDDPTRPEFVTFDTQTAGRGTQKDTATLLGFLGAYSELYRSYQLQRRTLGLAGWFDQIVTVGAVDGYLSCDRNEHRLVITHYLRTW